MIDLLIFACNGVLSIAFLVVVAVFAAAVLVALIDPMTPPSAYDEVDLDDEPEPVRNFTGQPPWLPRAGHPLPTQQQRGDES